jgi:uncharacterized membrane protein
MKGSATFILSFAIGILAFSCKKEEPVDSIDVGEVSYDTDVKSIISDNCTQCHAGSSPSAGMDISTKAGLQSGIETRGLISRINSSNNPMPASGLMSTENRAKIAAWQDQGFK